LAQAQAQEDETRRRLQELEQELAGLRAVTSASRPLRDAELERLRQECAERGILTAEPAMLGAYRDIKKAAGSALPVLLLGEPGTGKELFARAVHSLSPRADHAFVSVNMAALSPQLFESELFGHVRGSFTGAIADRKGYFELADHGTLFLDEVGDLPLDQQGKLLRALQEKSFYRVGATRVTTVDVRVVAATNKDLLRGVSEGWFREDLYFRLKGLVVRLPPLRERPQDIPLLAVRFIQDAAAHAAQDGISLSTEALESLKGHRWKGNIRELQHCLNQAVALAEGPVLTTEDLRLTAEVRDLGLTEPGVSGPELKNDKSVLSCLREHEFDMQATARALGWDRSTVTQRLKGLGFRALVETQGDHAKAALILAGDPGLAGTVELKLLEYYEHLIGSIESFRTENEAIAACKKRFKNLPERHFRSVEILVRDHFQRRK
jgi:transcriptional regulator with GAF, ATPase, and Fis domain